MIDKYITPTDKSKRPKNFDMPEGISVTETYDQDVIVDVNLSSLGANL